PCHSASRLEPFTLSPEATRAPALGKVLKSLIGSPILLFCSPGPPPGSARFELIGGNAQYDTRSGDHVGVRPPPGVEPAPTRKVQSPLPRLACSLSDGRGEASVIRLKDADSCPRVAAPKS